MDYNFTEIYEIENKYWDLIESADTFEYFTPINISEVKKEFLQKAATGNYFNPEFQYKPCPDNITLITSLKQIRNELKSCDNVYSEYYIKLVDEDIDGINLFQRRQSDGFSLELIDLFGLPTNDEYLRAVDILSTLDKKTPHREVVSFSEMYDQILCELERQNIEWTLKAKEMAPRISVNPVTKEITLNKSSVFYKSEIQRLIVHEIGTHVLRYENGLKQNSMIFSRGFPNYLETEEGLAILAEKKNGLLLSTDLSKYCCRLIGAYLCKDMDFIDIYLELSKYISNEDSFDIVARIKRGMLKTSVAGGLTKDQIYLKGLWKMESLDKDTLKKLYVGKVSIDDLNSIKSEYLNLTDIYVPYWV